MTVQIDLKGKTAVVLGGGRGLGKEIASVLSEAGANIFIGNRKEEESKESVASMEEIGVKAGYHTVDIVEDKGVEEFFAAAKDFGGGNIDIVIQNAGVIETDPLLEIDGDKGKKVFEVNAVGTAIVLKHALKHMKEQGYGKIVTIASIAGQNAMGMLEHYSASKAAVISLTKNAAKLGAPEHINVNGISPGIIRTNMWEEILDSLTDGDNENKDRDEVFDENVKEIIPFGVAQTERDIANTALYLCSDLAKEVTGQIIAVDGGTSI